MLTSKPLLPTKTQEVIVRQWTTPTIPQQSVTLTGCQFLHIAALKQHFYYTGWSGFLHEPPKVTKTMNSQEVITLTWLNLKLNPYQGEQNCKKPTLKKQIWQRNFWLWNKTGNKPKCNHHWYKMAISCYKDHDYGRLNLNISHWCSLIFAEREINFLHRRSTVHLIPAS